VTEKPRRRANPAVRKRERTGALRVKRRRRSRDVACIERGDACGDGRIRGRM
jgi:hypothetical protein